MPAVQTERQGMKYILLIYSDILCNHLFHGLLGLGERVFSSADVVEAPLPSKSARLVSSLALYQQCLDGSGAVATERVVASGEGHMRCMFEPAGAGAHTACGDGRAIAQVFAHVAKQCLHSPAAERAAAGQCSTSSFARSAKLQRRPYNFYREEVPSDPQAQARPTRLRRSLWMRVSPPTRPCLLPCRARAPRWHKH